MAINANTRITNMALFTDDYVLCEINVSCAFAIPDEAPASIARLTLEALRTV
jgi:hypothetical protein